jgi:hypothetical protein
MEMVATKKKSIEENKKFGRPYTLAARGINCRQCKTWIPFGERRAGQVLCTMANSWATPGSIGKANGVMKRKSTCQDLDAQTPKSKRPYFVCDICGELGRVIRSNQKRCMVEKKGEKTECQKEHHRLQNKGDDGQAIKEFHALHTPKPEPKKRTCLRCDKKFNSKGKYNRICEPCTLANENGTTRTARDVKEVQESSDFWDSYGQTYEDQDEL